MYDASSWIMTASERKQLVSQSVDKCLDDGQITHLRRQECFSKRVLVETNFEASEAPCLKAFWSLRGCLD